VADDHPSVRTGIRSAIEARDDMNVAKESGDATQTVRDLAAGVADVAVVDYRLGESSGETVLRRLGSAVDRVPVLIVSMYVRVDYVMSALTAGARGYVSKASPVELVVAGIRAVAAGGYFFDPPVFAAVKSHLGRNPARVIVANDERYQRLTEREQQVFRLLAEGFNTKEVAHSLELSTRTIENYQTSVFRKLKIPSKTALVRYAIELGIV